ncbi:MAG: hypothetical protein GY795_11165 [Desulfobacterales bacterium]|nr:hypothetical protein [Desulfobacterales bacterium]
MKKEFCDVCGEEIKGYMKREISYQDDTPQYNGNPATHIKLELCQSCSETIIRAIERTKKELTQ